MPNNSSIYHIVHVDRLASIVNDGYLYSDKLMQHRTCGTNIGMQKIKARRLNKPLSSVSNLLVGECVPFYFCPRSVMLYMIDKGNHPELAYKDGQEPIIHLEANMLETIDWAKQNNKKWCFTTTNAGSEYFEDYSNLESLDKIKWEIINSNDWKEQREYKQAEFLLEEKFSWELISRIGLYSQRRLEEVNLILQKTSYKPKLEILTSWYY